MSSVIVPTHNRMEMLGDCLRSLLALDHPCGAYEVIVVDAGSTDATAGTVARIAARAGGLRLEYVRSHSRDANTARNLGIAAARGDLLVLVDDDVIAPPAWLTSVVDGAREWPEAGCVGGPVRPLLSGSAPRTCAMHEPAGLFFDRGEAAIEVDELWGGNMAIRRDALTLVGGFRPGLPVAQEWEWEQRLLAAGGGLVYLPDAWLWHRRERSELRLSSMMREHFVRGYVKGRLGQPVTIPGALRASAGNLRHAATQRCTRGLTESARSLGIARGVAAGHATRLSGKKDSFAQAADETA
jgi:glycosyltransferase involved in cell wall biosynthesis